MTEIVERAPADRRWREHDVSRIPLWIYSDEVLYRRELDRLFYGPEWCFVGLGAELPEAANHRSDHQHADGDFGDAEGEVHPMRVVTEMGNAVAEHDDRRHGVLQFLDEEAAVGATVADRDSDHRCV